MRPNILCLFLGFLLWQTTLTAQVPADLEPPNYSPVAIGFSLGTQTISGVDVAFQVAPDWVFKVAFNYMDLSIRNFETDLGFLPEQISIDADMRFSSFEVLTEHKIFHKKLRMVGGFGYFPINHFKGTVLLANPVRFFDVDWTPGEVGYVGGSLSFRSPISPYIGIAFGDAIPKKQVGFSFNFGTYYKGRPDITIEGSNLLEHNGVNERTVEKGISSYRWMPVLSFRLAYKLHRPKPDLSPEMMFPGEPRPAPAGH